MTDTEAIELLTQECKDLHIEDSGSRNELCHQFEKLALYTSRLASQEAATELKRLLRLVQTVYTQCGGTLKICIENILLYKLARTIEMADNRMEILDVVPVRLRSVMMKYYNAAGI